MQKGTCFSNRASTSTVAFLNTFKVRTGHPPCAVRSKISSKLVKQGNEDTRYKIGRTPCSRRHISRYTETHSKADSTQDTGSTVSEMLHTKQSHSVRKTNVIIFLPLNKFPFLVFIQKDHRTKHHHERIAFQIRVGCLQTAQNRFSCGVPLV